MSIQGRTRRLTTAALVTGLGMLLLLGPLAPPASAVPTGSAVPAFDSTFATLLNTLRSTLGLAGLTVDPQLSSIARGWSTHMADSNTLAHNPALTSQVQGWSKVGENVGTGSAVTQVFNALVASPPHMKNMSDPAFSRVGVATVMDSRNRLWTTHIFMRPMADAPARAPRATAPPATTPPAPAATAAPKPVPTTAAPAAPPTTAAAPTTVPVPTTVAPAGIEVAGAAQPTEVAQPSAEPTLASATPAPGRGLPVPLLAGAVLLALLVLCGGGFLLRHSTSGSRSGPDSGRLPQTFEPPAEDLTRVLDLLDS